MGEGKRWCFFCFRESRVFLHKGGKRNRLMEVVEVCLDKRSGERRNQLGGCRWLQNISTENIAGRCGKSVGWPVAVVFGGRNGLVSKNTLIF